MSGSTSGERGQASPWHQTACILCECNCGLEVQLGGADGRRLTRIRGDKQHPISRGYACEKPSRLDLYQNGPDRVTRPLRRRSDGSYEEVDWDTAIREVADGLTRVRDTYGGDKIFYFGGGGQGNHLPGAYARSTLDVLGVRYRSNALAQEKTGEFFVNGRIVGGPGVRGDFEACEVGIFVGKNPWQSHGIPHARTTLRELARDPERALIVIDPRRSETAEMADIHLAVKPGRDAWLLAALIATLVQEDRLARDWLASHATGLAEVLPHFEAISIAGYCEIAGIPEAEVRSTARRIASARSVAVFEDLGVQMNRHSTLVSYLDKLLWALTGNFGRAGTQYVPSAIVALAGSGAVSERRSPVAGARIISGLVPCNVIADEILTDHPARYRAMLIEAGNPAHSLADSPRFREALAALEFVVAIDVAMSETARLADYVLPAATQFEKVEATFFNFEFPRNYFQLRKPLLDAPPGPLPEAEIHARLVEAMGRMPEALLGKLRAAAQESRDAFREVFLAAAGEHPDLLALAPVLLYRSLGEVLPDGLAPAAVLWAPVHLSAMRQPESLRRAGFEGKDAAELAESLFDAILASPTAVVFSVDEPEESFARVSTPDGKLHLAIDELLEELAGLPQASPPGADPDYPYVLSAGERRSFTANTIFRDPSWRKKDVDGALRMSPDDAAALGVADGDRVKLSTRRGVAEVPVEVCDRMQNGHVSLPNGLGLDPANTAPGAARVGVAPNELTSSEDRDWLAGTPWHKSVPARVERL